METSLRQLNKSLRGFPASPIDPKTIPKAMEKTSKPRIFKPSLEVTENVYQISLPSKKTEEATWLYAIT